MTDGPHLRVVDADATPEEVAAITAALGAVVAARQAAAAAGDERGGDGLQAWVRTSRMVNRRSGMARGPWRLSGRLPRRSRV